MIVIKKKGFLKGMIIGLSVGMAAGAGVTLVCDGNMRKGVCELMSSLCGN